MRRRAVLDRIVDDSQAVLLIGEEEEEYILSLERLPQGTSEGAQLEIEMEDGVIQKIVLLIDETEDVHRRVKDKLSLLQKRGSSLHRRK